MVPLGFCPYFLNIEYRMVADRARDGAFRKLTYVLMSRYGQKNVTCEFLSMKPSKKANVVKIKKQICNSEKVTSKQS